MLNFMESSYLGFYPHLEVLWSPEDLQQAFFNFIVKKEIKES